MSQVETGDQFVGPGARTGVAESHDDLSMNPSEDESISAGAGDVAAVVDVPVDAGGALEPADPVEPDDVEPDASASADLVEHVESASADAALDATESDYESDPDSDSPTDSADADEEPDASLDDPAQLVSAIEAILFVVDAPLPLAAMASALRQPVPAIEAAVSTLREAYDARDAGVEVRDSAGGVRIYTRPAHARHVERFLQDGQRSRLSQAALETLAVIAYRQPVTRSRVSAIRGVNVDGVVRTLLTRGLIVEVGNDPESGAGLFRTTELFLERMGMQSLEELPSLAPLLPDLDGLETEEL